VRFLARKKPACLAGHGTINITQKTCTKLSREVGCVHPAKKTRGETRPVFRNSRFDNGTRNPFCAWFVLDTFFQNKKLIQLFFIFVR
jgi:hypothetical protein